MSTNFLVDFTFFLIVALICSIGFQIAFICATGLAAITRYGMLMPEPKTPPLFGLKKKGDRDALPGTYRERRDRNKD
ncbi:MAG: hypothetical protein AAGI92_09780 [Pseudomonadota bacterium]